MAFTALPLGTLLAIAGAVGAAVTVLYILKLRRRPVSVPFSRIWQSVLRDKDATSLFSQLKRLLSLLLQILLVLLIVSALGDPRLSADTTKGRNLVVLIDASASMKATDVKPTRIEDAKRRVRELVRGLGAQDRLLVAQMDASLTPLSTMTSDTAALEQAIDRVQASDTRANLRQGLEFALDSLHDLSEREIVIVSDGALGDLAEATRGLALEGVATRFVPVGTSGKNVAITGFSVRRYPLDKSRYEVMLEVTNTSREPARVELSLLGDGQVTDITRLALGPEERISRFYKDLGGASHTLEAVLRPVDGTVDDLPADNHAYALMPERRRARVAVITPGNNYLEAALLLDEYLDVTMLEPRQYPPREAYDVTIFDGVAKPPQGRSNGFLYLNPPERDSPVPIAKAIENFGFDVWDKKSPMLRWIALEDIQVARGFTFKPSAADKVLGASELGPLLVSGRRDGKRFVALSFDPRNSDFVLRVAWPLFVLNVINDFIEEDTGYVSSFRTGEVWHVQVPSSAETVTLIEPGGRERRIPVKEGRAVHMGERAGFYRLVASAEGQRQELAFAGNLSDPDESHIAPVRELEIAGSKAEAVSGFRPGVRRELWVYLLWAVVLISVIEWITYHRRITV